MTVHIKICQTALQTLCRRYHVQPLALFGSVLREDFEPESDVAVLVEFEPGHTPGLGFLRLQREISELLGRPVDLHTYRSLSRYFRDEVAKQAEVQYERRTKRPELDDTARIRHRLAWTAVDLMCCSRPSCILPYPVRRTYQDVVIPGAGHVGWSK